VSEKYEFIDAEYAEHRSADPTAGRGTAPTITQMCTWLRVSKSGFYEWRNRPTSATAARRELLATKIKALFDANHGTYGYRRLHAALVRGGEQVSPELVRRLMRQLGLVACQPRPWRTTTIRDDEQPAAPDLVERDFTASAPGIKLVSDISYSAQHVIMCSRAGRPSLGMAIASGTTAHNHRSCRKARSRSPGLKRIGAGPGSPRCCRTASFAARSASRY
jgi:hypothetical protein